MLIGQTKASVCHLNVGKPETFTMETKVAPWTDHKGRLVPLKLATFLALFGPAFWVLWQWSQDDLGPKPVTEALHQTGTWAVYLLLGSLAVTPLRAIVYWPRLIDIRRMVGVAACLYLIGHFALYIYDQKGDMLRVASEIVLRFYLTIGFIGLLGIVALGVTSTDGWVHRLGSMRWSKLHRTIYWLMLLAFIHAFLQSKIDVTNWVMLSGIFFAMMMWRFASRRGQDGYAVLVVIALLACLSTALIEALWYFGKTGVVASRVLAANFDSDLAWRPSQIVLLALLVCIPLRLIGQRRMADRRKKAPRGA